MTRQLINTTDIPDDVVRAVLTFVAPPGVRGYAINLKNMPRGGHFKGWAYADGCGFHGARPGQLVTLGIGSRPGMFPYRGQTERHAGGYLPIPPLANKTEALVYVAAHELRHLWQYRVPRGRRVWGARGRMSERDADAYAIRMLRRWRRETPTVRALGWYLPEPKQPKQSRRRSRAGR